MKSAKVVRYFPLIPRLQRLFKTKKSAEEMIWHAKQRNIDGLLRHPADGEAWKSFDSRYPDFASDPRNVRLALASDGFNPFKLMSSTYSIWPILLVPYNMPPWIAMKQSSFILSTIIPGEKSPGNNIDIYIQPLINELTELWHGVISYDAASGQSFNLRAALMWTINDFPAYGMLSGWSTKGRFACPCCAENTESLWLYKGKKFSYMGHRRWLPENHLFRRQKQYFDNTEEIRKAPRRNTGSDILQKLQNVQFDLGKSRSLKRGRTVEFSEHHIWKKKSIFFELPYWEYNLLPHNLDVMHIEKNVCDNFIGTLLDLDKSKDNLQARQDLVDIGIKAELHPQILEDGSYLLPPTCFTMSKKEKLMFCQVLKNMKMPKGYASNISRCINVAECKIVGLKSHDCHVLIEELLPIALRSCSPSDEIIHILVEISKFLKSICAKVIDPKELDILQNNIAITLCKMERSILPSFFTIMVHLLIHLAEEVKLGGPVQYRWMYPFERFFIVLKDYVANKAQPEGSIAEGYIAEEGITFCSKYLERPQFLNKAATTTDAQFIFKFSSGGTPLGKVSSSNDLEISEEIKALAKGPNKIANRYKGLLINAPERGKGELSIKRQKMAGGSRFRQAKKVVCRGGSSRGGSSRGETSRETESITPSTSVHPDSQEEIECSGTQQASQHSFGGAAPATQEGIWLVDEQGNPSRRRGRTTCADIQNMPPGTRIHIEVNENNIPCNIPESTLLGTYLGVVARDPVLAPISFPDWRNKGMEPYKKKMLAEVESKFEFPGHIRHWILQSLGVKWRNHKTTLKAEHWDSRPIQEILETVPAGVDQLQWCQLVNKWSKPEDQAQACNLLAQEGLTPEEGNIEANERVFAIVMGPEHSGRVRTQGFGVTPTRFFPQSKNEEGSGSGSSFGQIASLREEFISFRDNQAREFASFRDEMRQFMQETQRNHPPHGGSEMGGNDNLSDA
ncbi:hypothetical protein KFK09_016936 [Dendrobium nobile]|uniref:DUF4218 domain-containing protein n=1 Tax=Dendrobium nobile TaxID=94219 RepID=A0A8T3B0Y5_DENNO|nr:hypothetical protein KFK09_016936 [Dendrobium nobile]